MNTQDNQHPEPLEPENGHLHPESGDDQHFDEESMSLSDYELYADPELEDLLDQAMGQVEVPGYLADRIIGQTMPGFEQQKLRSLHRISPSLVRAVAAVIAICMISVLGLYLGGVVDNTNNTKPNGMAAKPTDAPVGTGTQTVDAEQLAAKMASIDKQLAAVPALSEPVAFDVEGVSDADYDAYVDAQLDLIALRMNIIEDEQADALDREAVAELAVMDYQLQELMDQESFYF